MGRFARGLRKARERKVRRERDEAHRLRVVRDPEAAFRRREPVTYELQKGFTQMCAPFRPMAFPFACGRCGEVGEQYPDAIRVGRGFVGVDLPDAGGAAPRDEVPLVANVDALCGGCGATEGLVLTAEGVAEVKRVARMVRDFDPGECDELPDTDVIEIVDMEMPTGEWLPPRAGLAVYERAVAEEPQRPERWFALARVRETLGLWSTAIEAYERCVALDPGFVDAALNLAERHGQSGRYDLTLAVLDAAWNERSAWTWHEETPPSSRYIDNLLHFYDDCAIWVVGGGLLQRCGVRYDRVRWKPRTDTLPLALPRFHYVPDWGPC